MSRDEPEPNRWRSRGLTRARRYRALHPSGDPYGEDHEREAVYSLENRLTEAIDAADAGEFDGNEFGGGKAVLYAYGPDATRLFAAMEPHLRAFPARPAHVILRLGDVDDPAAVENRINL